jgi:hypothetical protein
MPAAHAAQADEGHLARAFAILEGVLRRFASAVKP